MFQLKINRLKLTIWALLLTAIGGALVVGEFSRASAAGGPIIAGPFTFISTSGTLNASNGVFTQTSGSYIKFNGSAPDPTPTPGPTPGPEPTPTCPPPDPNPVVAVYSGTYSLNSGEKGIFSLAVSRDASAGGGGVPEMKQPYTLNIVEMGEANITLQITGSTGTGTIQLVKDGQTIDTGTIVINSKVDVPPFVCNPNPGPTPVPTTVPTPVPTTQPPPTSADFQVESRTWTMQGTTYAFAKLIFPNGGYQINNWGQVSGSGNDFSVDVSYELKPGNAPAAVTTTAQIYTLGNLVPGNYTLTVKSGGKVVKTQPFTIESTPAAANPNDDARIFVRQQYLDFLGREPDGPGSDYWTNEITSCSDAANRKAGESEAQCVDRKRVNTSGAFFLSTEFQSTGYYLYRFYKGSLNRIPKLAEFKQDAPQLTNGIVVNNQLVSSVIESNKLAFANAWVNKPEFKAIYDNLSNQQYVDQLFTNTGATPTDTERAALVTGLNNNTETRATVLRKIVDGDQMLPDGQLNMYFTNYGKSFYYKEYNSAFVVMQYFGYLQRDTDDGGFNFWLNKLKTYGNFIDAEMVKSFITSAEYRSRFGQP